MKNKYSSFTALAGDYVKQFDTKAIVRYLKEHCQAETAKLMEQVAELKDQTFRFVDKWDMEPCETPYHLEKMEWDQTPNGDPEWVYMLNRHDYMYKLYMAYCLTEDRSYVEKLRWYLFHWIQNNEIKEEGTETTRTIDTGIRCMSWQFLLLHLTGSRLLSKDETEKIINSIREQYLNMQKRYIRKYTLSNWGVLQTTAICMGYMLFGEELPQNGLEDWAWKELETQLELQVMDDGGHWEQSIMYHMEVLLCSMKLLHICRFLNIKKEWLEEKAARMARYVMFAAGPDHRQCAQCDSDVTDVRDVLVKAAVLTGDGELRMMGYDTPDLDSVWLLGIQGVKNYNAMEKKVPSELTLNEVDTGNIYFRNGWSEHADYTYLTCGPLGSSHGHGDLTHISLYHSGRPFFVDSGRYSYREDEVIRPMLKSAKAHNVCVVDDISMAVPTGAWGFKSYPDAMKNYYKEKDGIHYAEMSYRAVLEKGKNCSVIRRVMVSDEGIWMIVNDISYDGSHSVKEYYHLDANVNVKKGNVQEVCWEMSSGDAQLKMYGEASFKEEKCMISPRYNQLEESIRLVKEQQFENHLLDLTVMADRSITVRKVPVYQFGREEAVSKNIVYAREFIISPTESQTFLIWNHDTFQGGKIYTCQGIPVYGKAMVISKKHGTVSVVRLRN